MRREDYIEIIFQGYINRKEYYQDHILFNIQKVQEDFGISQKEFIETSLKIIEEIKKEEKTNYEKLINELKLGIQNANNNEDVEYYKNRLEEVELSEPSYIYNPHLYDFSYKPKSFGIKELNELKKEFLNLNGSTKSDINNDVPQMPSNRKRLYNNIFVDEYYLLFETLYENFSINNKSRADVRFIFEKFKFENFINPKINYAQFLVFINETYELEIGRISDYKETSERKSLFNNALELFKLQQKENQKSTK